MIQGGLPVHLSVVEAVVVTRGVHTFAAAPALATACMDLDCDALADPVFKGHRANGFTTDGGFAEYAVNNINTLAAIPDSMSDEEATLVGDRRYRDVRIDGAGRPGVRRLSYA
jgi:NADPH:quinone reductase-like Zn-dependent oxidoreductase